MTEGAQKRLGFSAIGGRAAKADKIAAILAAAGKPLNPEQRVLDIGTGSGEIAARLAQLADVTCCDAIDQRVLGKDLPFATITDWLPFASDSFDVVISNHVIEHVPDPAAHLAELRRVTRTDGVAYLATPNRWWPWEFHTRRWLLHYLPSAVYNRLGQRRGWLDEPLQLMSLPRLRSLCHGYFEPAVWHARILQDPERFALTLPPFAARLIGHLPQPLLNATAGLQPALLLVLRPV